MNVGEDTEQRWTTYIVGGIQPPRKIVWRFLKNLKIELSNSISGYTSENKVKTLIQKDIHTSMFIAAVFTISCSSIYNYMEAT